MYVRHMYVRYVHSDADNTKYSNINFHVGIICANDDVQSSSHTLSYSHRTAIFLMTDDRDGFPNLYLNWYEKAVLLYHQGFKFVECRTSPSFNCVIQLSIHSLNFFDLRFPALWLVTARWAVVYSPLFRTSIFAARNVTQARSEIVNTWWCGVQKWR